MILFKRNNQKNVFMGKRKVEKYLKQLNNEDTTQAKLLRMYIDGELEVILKNYRFDVIEIYVDGNKKLGLDLQINLRNMNRNYGVDFLKEHYETCFYVAGCRPEEVENSILRFNYQNFDLNNLLQEVEAKLDKNIRLIGAYKYKENIALIEVSIDESPTEILFDEFYLFEKDVSRKDSQAPYLEQFLDSKGETRISDIYGNINIESLKESRFTFFMYYANTESVIKTPYGELKIESIDSLPDRLKHIIEFEEVE